MIDARGLSCPEPLLLLKKALRGIDTKLTMLVSAKNTLENVSTYLDKQNIKYNVIHEDDHYKIEISR